MRGGIQFNPILSEHEYLNPWLKVMSNFVEISLKIFTVRPFADPISIPNYPWEIRIKPHRGPFVLPKSQQPSKVMAEKSCKLLNTCKRCIRRLTEPYANWDQNLICLQERRRKRKCPVIHYPQIGSKLTWLFSPLFPYLIFKLKLTLFKA